MATIKQPRKSDHSSSHTKYHHYYCVRFSIELPDVRTERVPKEMPPRNNPEVIVRVPVKGRHEHIGVLVWAGHEHCVDSMPVPARHAVPYLHFPLIWIFYEITTSFDRCTVYCWCRHMPTMLRMHITASTARGNPRFAPGFRFAHNDSRTSSQSNRLPTYRVVPHLFLCVRFDNPMHSATHLPVPPSLVRPFAPNAFAILAPIPYATRATTRVRALTRALPSHADYRLPCATTFKVNYAASPTCLCTTRSQRRPDPASRPRVPESFRAAALTHKPVRNYALRSLFNFHFQTLFSRHKVVNECSDDAAKN